MPLTDDGGYNYSMGTAMQDWPAHLVRLKDEQWALWRCVCLRGAGFPAEQALALAAPVSADVADQILCAEQEVEHTRHNAIDALNTVRRAIQQPHQPCDAEHYACIVKILRTVRTIQFPQKLEGVSIDFIDCPALTAFLAAYQHLSALHTHFQEAFSAETVAVSRAIHAIARTDRFREAVLWQNQHAIHTGIASLLGHPPEKTAHISRQRSNEALVANYVQRYCMKNDSIGFFGPVGYANIVPLEEAIRVQPGTQLLATRSVYFEGWGIDALADVFSKNISLRPWCIPRLMPHVSISTSGTLQVPFASPVRLSAAQNAILHACDGRRTAKDIAHHLLLKPIPVVHNELGVYTTLEQLSAAKRIIWAFDLPPEGTYPERNLREHLQRIDDETLRTICLDVLTRLEVAREAVAQSAGDAVQLDTALDTIQKVFIAATGLSPTRSEGKMYAARTLVYEDCRRDIQLDLGPAIVHAIEQPLSLLLRSARWFACAVAERYHEAFLDAYAEMTGDGEVGPLNFADFWLWVQALLFDEDVRLVDALVPLFQEMWAEMLPLPTNQHHVAYSSEELRPRILDAFAAPGPAWNAACYHSPDVLIQASSAEAIRRGDYQFILGEFHVAMNTLQISAFLSHHTAPDELLAGAAFDVQAPRIIPVRSRRDFPISRVRSALITPKDFRLTYIADAGSAPAEQKSISLGDLLVEPVQDQLIIRTHDGSLQFNIIEVFAEFLSWQVVNCFKIFPALPHTPRVSIDRLVIARETWRFTPAELPFAQEKVPAQRFLAARRWAMAQGMPRFVFVKVPTEQKPCFVDFFSPIYIDMLAKLVRQNMESNASDRSIVISEMLPTPDQLWLPDAEGHLYTSELRFVAVDLADQHF